MRISDWSSDVCSSDLASVGSRTDAMRYQLAQFDIQDCDILFLTSMLQNFAVDIVPIGHFRRLVVNGPRAVVIAEDLEKYASLALYGGISVMGVCGTIGSAECREGVCQ